MKTGNDDRLLKEGLPSYMVIDKADVKGIFDSFKNIFKTAWSSIKLLSNTLALNLKVIAYTGLKDQKRIKEVFSEFAAKRATYDTEMQKNLEYFTKNYNDPDMLGGYGPGMLAFAANPLLFISNRSAGKRASPEKAAEDKPEKPVAEKEKPKASAQKISDRVKAAMIFFGFRVNENISEAVQTPTPASAPTPAAQAQPAEAALTPEQTEEKMKLESIANEMLKTETEHAQSLLSTLAGRPAVIKKIVEAKNFDEMIAATAEGERIGMDLASQAFRTAYSNIVTTLKKESQDDPEKFKKSVEDMRAKYPEIVEKDDIKAMTAFMFGTAKAGIQADLTKSYNSLAEGAKAAMQLPIKEDVKVALGKTETGRKYLAMLSEFERNIESGQQEMSALAAKKV